MKKFLVVIAILLFLPYSQSFANSRGDTLSIKLQMKTAKTRFLERAGSNEKYLKAIDTFVENNATDYKKLGQIYTRIKQYMYSKIGPNTDLEGKLYMGNNSKTYEMLYYFMTKIEYHLRSQLPRYNYYLKGDETDENRANIKDGYYTIYSTTGEKLSEEYLIGGELFFKQTVYHKNGKTQFNAEVLGGKYINNLTIYDENGTIVEKGDYSRTGVLRKLEVYEKEVFDTGTMFPILASVTYYDMNGKREKMEILNNEGIAEEKTVILFKNGVPHIQEFYEALIPPNITTGTAVGDLETAIASKAYLDAEGKYNGKYYAYKYVDGDINKKFLEIEFTYSDGMLNGPYIQYHIDGTPSTKGQYKDGKEVGISVSYNPKGIKTSEVEHINGSELRKFTPYNLDGTAGTPHYIDKDWNIVQ